MIPLSSTTLLFFLFLIFFVITFVKALALKRQKDLFFCKLTEANGFFDEISEELKEIHEKNERTKQFKTSLTVAELTTQLQKPRLSTQTFPSIKIHFNQLDPGKIQLCPLSHQKKYE